MMDDYHRPGLSSLSSDRDEPRPRLDFGACHQSPQSPRIVFGPVPSRRLGRSVGINNIPPKVCSYSCLYCQVGPTTRRTLEPQVFYPPEQVATEVLAHVGKVRERHERIDYLTFVPDGEPTLDSGLGATIRLLRPLDIRIAVISNGSLLWRQEVREALRAADLVSVKVDAVDEPTWRRINRPPANLGATAVQDGIRRFFDEFDGRAVSETMLVQGVNDNPESVRLVGEFLGDIGISLAYLAIPTRPTPYAAITAPGEESINRAYQLLAAVVPRVEYLIGYEGDAFATSGDPRSDLLSITAVHPMRASAAKDLLGRAGATWAVVEDLIAAGQLKEVTYQGERFYLRRLAV